MADKNEYKTSVPERLGRYIGLALSTLIGVAIAGGIVAAIILSVAISYKALTWAFGL